VLAFVLLGCLCIPPPFAASLKVVPEDRHVPDVALPPLPALPAPAPVPIPAPSKPEVKVPDAVKSVPAPSPPPLPIRPDKVADVVSKKATDVVSKVGGGSPSGAGRVEGGRDSAGTATSSSTEAMQPQAAPVRKSLGAGSDRSSGRPPGVGTPGDDAPSVREAVAAPLRRWIARVWPAIALGPIGEALARQLASLEKAVSDPMSALARSLSLLPGNPGVGDILGASARSPEPNASRSAPFSSFTPHGEGMSLLATMITVLAALVGVVALARLTVGEDLFSSRWLH
jgi:hypothetical protein